MCVCRKRVGIGGSIRRGAPGRVGGRECRGGGVKGGFEGRDVEGGWEEVEKGAGRLIVFV